MNDYTDLLKCYESGKMNADEFATRYVDKIYEQIKELPEFLQKRVKEKLAQDGPTLSA